MEKLWDCLLYTSEGGPGWAAVGRRGIGVLEGDAPAAKPVQVWCEHRASLKDGVSALMVRHKDQEIFSLLGRHKALPFPFGIF